MNRSNDLDKAEREIFNFYNSLLELRNNITLLKKYLKNIRESLNFHYIKYFRKTHFFVSIKQAN